MSSVDQNLAEAALALLGGLECEERGGSIGPDGQCSMEGHAHCPFCGPRFDCPHGVGRWDDTFGYSGPEFPRPPEHDDPILKTPKEDVRQRLGDLAPLWDVYLENVEQSSADWELLEKFVELLDWPVIEVTGWERDDSDGVGQTLFAMDADALGKPLMRAIARVRDVFDQFAVEPEEEQP